MGQDQLYLLETLIKKISLGKNNAVKILDDLLVNIKFDHIVNYDIDFRHFLPMEALTVDSGDQKIIANTGKSFLFVSRPSVLRQLLDVDPIQISLLEDIARIGGVDVKLQKEFAEMVKLFESIGIVKSCTEDETYDLYDDNKKVVGNIAIQIKMSCFGRNIQTAYQITKDREKNTCLFKQRNTSRIFLIERLPEERIDNEPLIAPLYAGWTGAKVWSEVQLNENVSLTGLFERGTMETKQSMYNPPAGGGGGGYDDFDVVSMCYRPQENKFLDFLNLISMDVQTQKHGTTVNIQKEKLERAQDLLKSLEGTVCYSKVPEQKEEEQFELTSEKIEKKLCGSKDCPAVQKFKDYGIGPLATGKGLGTLYNQVESPVTYGMSHTYGIMREYGPYGVFSRPKHEELSFVPPKNYFEKEKPIEENIKKKPRLCAHCRIFTEKTKRKKRGHQKEKSFNRCPEADCQPIRLRGGKEHHDILRLRGGGGEDEEQEFNDVTGGSFPEQFAVEDNIILPKSPMLECKSVMDKFDDILTAYRKALGPCGQAICPYAQTIAEESCRKACPPKVSYGEQDNQQCPNVPCDIPECPYSPEQKSKVFPAGCGSPRCAYAQYKLGLVDDDAELELQFLPPALTTNCGDHRCKYPPPIALPPIHWDCPDPLPKGKCKNPNCPFLPPPLRKFKTKELKTGPCGSPMCPYAIPPPCGQPTCPFNPQPCPMPPKTCAQPSDSTSSDPIDAKGAEFKGTFKDACPTGDCGVGKKKKRKSREERDRCRSKKEESCDNPECVFNRNNSKQKDTCDNPACPFSNKDDKQKSEDAKKTCSNPNKPKTVRCINPYCPQKQQMISPPQFTSCPPQTMPCPYVQQIQEEKRKSSEGTVCSNPDCIYNKQKEDFSICDNPGCPLAKITSRKQKNKRQKKEDNGSVCSNPECPENKKIKDKDIARKNDDSSICDNPGCPFAKNSNTKKKKRQDKGDNESVCSNPDCPENRIKEDKDIKSICSNPDCPAHQAKQPRKNQEGGDTNCKKAESESICSNPDCPETKEREQESDCSNPDCPFSRTSAINKQGEICDNPLCPYGLPLPTACGIPNCPYDQKKEKIMRGDNRPLQSSYQQDVVVQPLANMDNCDETPETCDNPDCTFYDENADNVGAFPHQKRQKKHGRKKRSKFVYTMGDVYRGVKVGHRECVNPGFHVPPHMGWLWNVWTPILNLKPRRGWRPGALTKEIAARIRAHRRSKGLGILQLPHFKQGGGAVDSEELKVVAKPTLHIQKKEGAYWITMNPLKDPKSLVENEDPYMECTPMTFKITKNKKPDENCYCNGEDPPLQSESSDSELDIEFTPPAGIIHPDRFKKRPNTVCVTAQYDPADFEVKKEDKKNKAGKGGKKEKKGGKAGKGKKGKKKK